VITGVSAVSAGLVALVWVSRWPAWKLYRIKYRLSLLHFWSCLFCTVGGSHTLVLPFRGLFIRSHTNLFPISNPNAVYKNSNTWQYHQFNSLLWHDQPLPNKTDILFNIHTIQDFCETSGISTLSAYGLICPLKQIILFLFLFYTGKGNVMQELQYNLVYSDIMVYHPLVTSHFNVKYKFKFHNNVRSKCTLTIQWT
jgi:hypothetical protein